MRNGNTLISTGVGGLIFEVTPDKKIVWSYIIPAKAMDGIGVHSRVAPVRLAGHGGFGGGSDGPGGASASFTSFVGGDFNGVSGVFRAYCYGTDLPGLAGKNLTPGKSIEELEAKPPVAQK